MPEQPAEVQRINWSSCFAFTQLFRTFKMALHPGKLGLALAAIVLVGLWGTILDGIWFGKHRPLADEVNAFWRVPDIEQWRQDQIKSRLGVTQRAFAQVDVPLKPEIQKDLESTTGGAEGVDKALSVLKAAGEDHLKHLKPGEQAWQVAANFNDAYTKVERLQTQGVFDSLWHYEASAMGQFMESVARLNFAEGLSGAINGRRALGPAADMELIVPPAIGGAHVPAPAETDIGALGCFWLMAQGVHWLVVQHPWYALFFGLGKLAIFAFFGGAICRMAALNFARDERIPLKTALAFAWRKYVGFVTAPLLPIGMIVGLGVLLAVGGLVGAIPGIGGFISGLLLFLALAAGFVMALVLIGFLAGGSLMWPTIAVEGSDSFDAMSRSYSYVYSRPWKAVLYALVATIYGALCYLFVRFFVWVMLWITRCFIGMGMKGTSRPGTGLPGGTKIDALWTHPTFDELVRPPLPFAAGGGDWIGQVLVWFWVGLLVLLLSAFLTTFYFCASTVIYYLLRREVDATDLEDVYSEDVDEEGVEHGPVSAESGATAGPVALSTASSEPPAGTSGSTAAEPPPRA